MSTFKKPVSAALLLCAAAIAQAPPKSKAAPPPPQRITGRKDSITVTGKADAVSPAPDANQDTVSVDRGMLDALPAFDMDYIGALSRFLDPSAPAGAGLTLIVDGMESRNVGVTPSAIQEIRINNNPYTAEYPRWSRRRIEIITKTAADAWHGTFNFLFRDHHLNARDAFAVRRPEETRRIFEGSLFGPVGDGKRTSFLLSALHENENLQAVVFAQTPGGPFQANVATPRRNTFGAAKLTHKFNERHTAFWQLNYQDTFNYNQRVGGTTLPEAGVNSRFREDEFIFNHSATVSPSLLSQFRILLGRFHAPFSSITVAPGINVTDAFTGGGAQADVLRTEFHTAITWLITQSINRHSLKYGVNVPDWSRRGMSDRTLQQGAFSYASLGDYAAGRSFAITLQRGDPRTIFVEKNIGFFLQDDWQVRPGLSVSLGLRYDWQSVFGDNNNVQPRAAVAWAPKGWKKTVLRAGAGLFYDRSGPAPIWDIQRFNGLQLRRYVITGTEIPANIDLSPTSVVRLDPRVQLPGIFQFSAGIERQLSKKTALSVQYVGLRNYHQFRSRDANAPSPPLFATRPDAALNQFRQIESAGYQRGNGLEINLRGSLGERVTTTLQYVFQKQQTNVGGLSWFPAASFNPQGEWGRTDSDRRHALGTIGTVNIHRWANFGYSFVWSTGIPFNITTGRDENRDGFALDRPAGVTRNTGIGPGAVSLDLRWMKDWKFNAAKKEKSPLVAVTVDAFNVFNHVNYQSFVGSLTSPFYGRAVGALPPRRLQLGFRFQF